MKNSVICKDAEGFNDQLRADTYYSALEYKNNSVRVENDKGEQKWYGAYRFTHPGAA